MSEEDEECWFEQMFGVPEAAEWDDARSTFEVGAAHTLVVVKGPARGRSFDIGLFETPSVQELRSLVSELRPAGGVTTERTGIRVCNISGEARALHLDPENANAVFQVASQFNCLEMSNHRVRPEDGVTRYCRDKTQGPACAMACPAATIWRNYFWAGRGQAGGNDQQLNLMSDAASVVNNAGRRFWKMQNGYLMPARAVAMAELGAILSDACLAAIFRSRVRVGVHWLTETAQQPSGSAPHQVTQVLVSAVPVASSLLQTSDWAPLARLVLEAAYEATLLAAAVVALRQSRRVTVFVTLVGGGAFGNEAEWIAAAMKYGLNACRDLPLDVRVVHHCAESEGDAFNFHEFPSISESEHHSE